MTFFDFLAEQWLPFTALAAMVAAFLVLEARKGGNTVSHHEATRMVNSGAAVFVDVRDSADYKSGHIVDALSLPHTSLAKNADQLEKHKSKKIIVVDKMGQHSGAAGKVLMDKGFDVLRMKGGMMEWSQQNLPLVKA